MKSDVVETIMVKLIGGPKDGSVFQIKKPFKTLIVLKSDLRSDVFHIYEFDRNKDNIDEPIKFKFAGYEKNS